MGKTKGKQMFMDSNGSASLRFYRCMHVADCCMKKEIESFQVRYIKLNTMPL